MSSSVFVVGNWKMNGSISMAREFCHGLDRAELDLTGQVEVSLCVPDTLLAEFAASEVVRVGAQNVSEHDSGAYTGEISADLIKEQGCDLVIVGHSERRQLFAETSEQVAKKAAQALRHGITPIVCVGETEQQREQGNTFDVVGEQLHAIQQELEGSDLQKIWLAYEPVWAIGTGKTAQPDQAQEIHGWIRAQIPEVGVRIPLLYGGSVKAENAEQLFQQQDIDGGLIGGASLDLNEFQSICKIASALTKPKG